MRVLILLTLVALASAAVRLPPIAGARGGNGGALNPTPPKGKKDPDAVPSPRPAPVGAGGPPADVVLIPSENLAIADGATKVWTPMSLKITSDATTQDRFMVFAPVCPGASPACTLDATAQRTKGLLMGGAVGKWDCITVGKTAVGAPGEVLQEFQVKFKSAADGSAQAVTFFSKGNSEHVFSNICWHFHAVPFKSVVTADWGPAANKVDLPSTSSAPDADGRMYPGWESERNADTAFCWAFEFESNLGKTTEILNYYRPPFTPNPKTFPNADQAWKALSLEDKVTIMHCKKGSRKQVYETRCDALSDKAKDPVIAASIIEFVTQMRKIDFEGVVRCEEDCRSAGAADIPDCNELFTAHGKPVLFFAAPHMHQEVTSPVTFEVMHERCETNWNKFAKEVKCMDAIYGPEAKSSHLHTSMRMSPNTQQTKAAAALIIFFGDILFAGKIRDDADASYMSAPSQKAVNDLFQQIEKGYMLVEAKNHADGSAWGEFKKARNALRAHLYGPYRFGFELRAGTQALSKLAGIYTALKDLRPDSMPPVERVTKGSLAMVKAICTILAQRNFGPNSPVRLLQLPIPGQPAPPPAGYNINALYNNVLEHRNVGDCEKGTSCPLVKPAGASTSPRKACGAETLQKLTVPISDIWIKGKWGRAPAPAESSAFNTARVSMAAQMGAGKCSDADDGAIIPEIVNLYKKSSKFETFIVEAI